MAKQWHELTRRQRRYVLCRLAFLARLKHRQSVRHDDALCEHDADYAEALRAALRELKEPKR